MFLAYDSVVHTEFNSFIASDDEPLDPSSGSGYRVDEYTIGMSSNPLISTHKYGLLAWLTGFRASVSQNFYLGFQLKYYNTTDYFVKVEVDKDTTIAYIAWSRLFFDTTEIQMTQVNFIDFGWFDGTNGVQNKKINLEYYIQSNYIVGVTKLQMNTQSKQDFTLDIANTTTIQTTNKFNYLNFTYFNYRIRTCPTGYPNYSDSKKMCFDSCPVNGTYLNTAINPDGLCFDCNPNCLTCTNSSTCKSCNTSAGLVLNSSNLCQCDSSLGYVNQTSTGECKLCSELMVGCVQCTITTKVLCSSCLTPNYTLVSATDSCQCQNPYLVVGSACVNCLETLPACVSCSSNLCDECDASLFLTSVSGNCQCISGYFCAAGPQTYCTQCLPCTSQYNRQNIGGNCQCMQNYSECSTENCNKTLCYYSKIDLNYSLTLTKDPDSNSLEYEFVFNDPKPQFESIDWSKVINLGLPSSTNYTYVYSEGKLSVVANYHENLQGNTTTITIDLSKSELSAYSQVQPATQTFTIKPENNLAANVYDQSTYQGTKVLQYLSFVVLGLGYLTFFIGLYNSKLVSTEMMGVLQLAYVALLLLDYGDPLIKSLLNLRFVYGIDTLVFGSSAGISTKIDSLFYNSLIIKNINVLLGILLIPLIVSLLFYILSVVKQQLKQKYTHYLKLALGEYLIVPIEFILYNFCISTYIFITMNTDRSIFYSLSYAQVGLIGVIVVFNLVFFGLKDFNYFGEFKYMFKIRSFGAFYYYIPTCQRILIALALVIGNNSFISAAVSMGLLLIGGVYVAVLWPFSDSKHNFRSLFNTICSIGILAIIMLIKLNGVETGESIFTKLPYAIIAILLLVVFVSLAFIIRKFIQDYFKSKKGKQQQQLALKAQAENIQVEQDYNKQLQQIINSSNTNRMTRRLLAGKKKRANKNKILEPTIEPATPTNIDSLKMEEQIRLNRVDNVLSPQKIQFVNNMLYEGLV